MPDDSELRPGDVVDRYEIVREIAKGGMGRVWLARFGGKHGFEKQVAIKTVLPELASDAQFRSMLLDEARLCSRLEHANVAQILDVGERGNVPYIVFEWVEGASLEQICRAAEDRGEPVALGPLLRVMADVCSGIHAAHELTDSDGRPLNVVHRDVTPNNIVVSRKGFAKVIDFGVAKAKGRIAGETRSGIVKGTPQYMAPEQARGDKVDRRADVWAVGAVLYRALAGAPPFKDRFDLEDFVRKRRELAPLPETIPADVREVVAQAMQRDPADRFVSADELRFALERAMSKNDTRRSIVDLFPPAPPRGTPGSANLPTAPDDIALAQTSTAMGAVSTAAESVVEHAREARTLPSHRPGAKKGVSPGLKIALVVAVAMAAIALVCLGWAVLSS